MSVISLAILRRSLFSALPYRLGSVSAQRRSRVVHHNARLHKGAASELRDQGLARPQVLLVLPFRDSALRTVNALVKLLGAKDVAHRSR